jgi:hypothetical protein
VLNGIRDPRQRDSFIVRLDLAESIEPGALAGTFGPRSKLVLWDQIDFLKGMMHVVSLKNGIAPAQYPTPCICR